MHRICVAASGLRTCRRRERARASCSARRSGLGADRRNRLDSLRYCGPRRIEQERVIADDATCGPVHFDDQIEIRLVDRLRGRDLQVRRVVRTLLDGDASARQGCRILHVVVAVDRKVGDLRYERIEFVLLRGSQLDASRQRLAEAGIQTESAQAQRQRRHRKRREARQQAPNDQGFRSHADLESLLAKLT